MKASTNFLCLSVIFSFSLFAPLHSLLAGEVKIQRVLDTGVFNTCITQDKDELLWFGGGESLFCYDGYELKKVKITGNENSYPKIRSIFVDKEGTIWFLVENQGLYSYDKNTGICKGYKPEPGNPNSLTSNNANRLPDNITGDKNDLIWIGTDDGLNSFNKKTGKFTQYKHNPNNHNSLSNNSVWTVFVDKDGLLWIGTKNGLNCYNKKTGKFRCYKHDPNNANSISDNFIHAIIEDKEGNLWIGTKNAGIDKFDKKTKTFTHYRHDPNNSNSLLYNGIHHIVLDQFNNLWICYEDSVGIGQYNIETNTFKHYSYDPKDSNSISSNNILYSFEDNTGIIWLTDDAGNINKCIWKQDVFENYLYDPKDPSSISSDHIAKLYEDRGKNIWLGTYKGGLSLYTRNGKFENFKPIANDPSSSSVFSILDAPYGKLWLGATEDEGFISLFDIGKKKVLKNFKNPYSDHTPCLLTKDNKDPNIIWFASFFVGGLFKFNATTEKFTQYKHIPSEINSVSNESAFSIFQDGNILWIGTRGGGLTKFDKTTGTCAHYRHDPKDKNSISGNIVIEPYIDNKENFWVTTEDGGLNKFDRKTEKFTSYGISCGFPSNSIRHILEDNEGYLWISTDSGLAKFDPNVSKVVKLFTKADGLSSNQFVRMANALKDSKGDFWFPTLHGTCKFNPKEANKIQKNSHVPPIVLTSFKSKEATCNEDGIKKITNIKLPWPDNSFEFTFAALDYMDPEKNQYAYKLEGFEKDWTYTGTNRYGKYTNIPPGKYTLCLKGSNNDGVWNEKGTSIKVTITPPFWMTLCFKILAVIIILSSIGGVFLLRIRSLKKKAIHMRDHAIAEITAQLAHDIRSPLAALNTAVKHLKDLSEQERILIRNATRRISDIAHNLLSKYKMKEKDAPEEQKHLKAELVSSLLDHLIAEKRVQMTEKSIDLVLELELGNNTHSCFVDMEPGKFKRVISNLINNASEAIESNGIIRILLALEKETTPDNPLSTINRQLSTINCQLSTKMLAIKIIDNGKGIPEDILLKIKQEIITSNKKEGHGLGVSSAIQNIKSWGGTYDIQSTVGKGTTFIIKLPIAKEPDWFQHAIILSQNTCIIILDDDESIHNIWQTHFRACLRDIPVNLNHFYEPLAFTEYCKNSRSEHDLFLIDYELINSKETGLDLIEKLDLKTQAILVTSRYEESEIRERIKKLGIKIIPKSFAPYIPISVVNEPLRIE